MTDQQRAEIIALLQTNDCQLIIPQTGPIIIRRKLGAPKSWIEACLSKHDQINSALA